MQKHGHLESQWDSIKKLNSLIWSFQGFANKVTTCCCVLPSCHLNSNIFTHKGIRNVFGDPKGKQRLWCWSRQLRCHGLAHWTIRLRGDQESTYIFLAVQNSSIGDLVTDWLTEWVSEWVTFWFWHYRVTLDFSRIPLGFL